MTEEFPLMSFSPGRTSIVDSHRISPLQVTWYETQTPLGPIGAFQDVETENVSSEFGIAVQFRFGSGMDSGKEIEQN